MAAVHWNVFQRTHAHSEHSGLPSMCFILLKRIVHTNGFILFFFYNFSCNCPAISLSSDFEQMLTIVHYIIIAG